MLIGLVASAFVAGQMYVSRRVAGTLANASTTILGTVARLDRDQLLDDLDDNASSTNDSFSGVQETSGASQFHTVVHAENTGSSHSGFVMAEAPGPYLGALLPFDRSLSSESAVALQVCEDCDDFVLGALPTVEEEEDGWKTVTLVDEKGGKKKIKFRVEDLYQDVNGAWRATIEFLGEDGTVRTADFLGVSKEELDRLGLMMNQSGRDQQIDQRAQLIDMLTAYYRGFAPRYRDELYPGSPIPGVSKEVLGWVVDHIPFFPEGEGLSLGIETLGDLEDRYRGNKKKEIRGIADLTIEAWKDQDKDVIGRFRDELDIRDDQEIANRMESDLAGAGEAGGFIYAINEGLRRQGINPDDIRLDDPEALASALSALDRDEEWKQQTEGDAETLTMLDQFIKRYNAQQTDLTLRALIGGERLGGVGGGIEWGPWSPRGSAGGLLAGNQDYEDVKADLKTTNEQRAMLQAYLAEFYKRREEVAQELYDQGYSKWEIEAMAPELPHGRAIQALLYDSQNAQYDTPEGVEVVLEGTGPQSYINMETGSLGGPGIHSTETVASYGFTGQDGTAQELPGVTSATDPRVQTVEERLRASAEPLDQAWDLMVFDTACGGDQACYDKLADAGMVSKELNLDGVPTQEAPSLAEARLQEALAEKPLQGLKGQPIDVAVGGEYDVLTDLVRTSGSAEQILWVRLDAEEGGADTLQNFFGQIPKGNPVGITQREDQYIAPEEMALTGRAGHPQDWPEDTRASWATYPQDFLFIRRNSKAVLPEGVAVGFGTRAGSDPLAGAEQKLLPKKPVGGE